MTTLEDIERRAAKYAEARATLQGIVQELTRAIEAMKADALPVIRKCVDRAAEHHDKLRALVEEAPELFAKPRSLILHGIKLGYQKGKGRIEFEDADRTVALIKKHFPEQADVLIVTTERPAKDALNALTAAELRKIGVSITEGGDVVFIRPVDSAVDKMVDALLKAATEETA